MMTKKQIGGIVGLTLAMFMGVLDSTIVNMALPKIQNHFHATLTDVDWVSTVYVLALSVFIIIAAKIGDQYGRKKTILAGVVIFTFFSGACIWAPSLLWLIIFRFFQGIGGAMITPIVMPIGIELVGTEKLPLVASIVGSVTGLAAAGGPPIGGLIIQYFRWEWIFAMNLPIGFLTMLLIAACVRESWDNTISKKLDFWGMILLSGGLFGLIFGLLKGQSYGWKSLEIISALCGGGVLLFMFVVVELRITKPLVELSLFKERTFSASAFICCISGMVLVCPILIFNYYLQEVLSYQPLHATLIIAELSLMVFFTMPLGTYIAQRTTYIFVNLMGLFLIAMSLLGMTLITDKMSDGILSVFMLLNGTGFGFMSQSMVSSIRFLRKEKSGIGSGIINASRQLGTCLGMALMVACLNTGINSAKDQTKAYGTNLATAAQISPLVRKQFNLLLDAAYSNKIDEQKLTKQKAKLTNTLNQTNQLPTPRGKNYYHQSYLSLNLIESKLIKNHSYELLPGVEESKRNVKLVAQGAVVNKIKSQIHNRQITQVTKAFNYVYLLGALIAFVSLPATLLTDRKQSKNRKQS